MSLVIGNIDVDFGNCQRSLLILMLIFKYATFSMVLKTSDRQKQCFHERSVLRTLILEGFLLAGILSFSTFGSSGSNTFSDGQATLQNLTDFEKTPWRGGGER